MRRLHASPLADPQAAFDEDARARRQFDRTLAELRGALQAAGKEAPPAPGPALEAYAPGQLAQAWREVRRSSPWTLRAQGPEKDLIVAARDASETFCPDAAISEKHKGIIREAKLAKDTVGGLVEAHVFGCPIRNAGLPVSCAC